MGEFRDAFAREEGFSASLFARGGRVFGKPLCAGWSARTARENSSRARAAPAWAWCFGGGVGGSPTPCHVARGHSCDRHRIRRDSAPSLTAENPAVPASASAPPGSVQSVPTPSRGRTGARSGRPGELRVYLVYLVKVYMSYTPPEKKVCPCRHLHQLEQPGFPVFPGISGIVPDFPPWRHAPLLDHRRPTGAGLPGADEVQISASSVGARCGDAPRRASARPSTGNDLTGCPMSVRCARSS